MSETDNTLYAPVRVDGKATHLSLYQTEPVHSSEEPVRGVSFYREGMTYQEASDLSEAYNRHAGKEVCRDGADELAVNFGNIGEAVRFEQWLTEREDGDVLYRNVDEEADGELEEVNRRFNEELEKWHDGKMGANEYVVAGNPAGVLKQFVPDLPIILRQKVLSKSRKKHALSIDDLQDLPSALASPIFVFKSSNDTISALTELKSGKGENIFVAIELGANKQIGHNILEVNDILTIHGREIENVVNPIVENKSLVWVDKEKGLRWLSSAKSNSQAIANEALVSAANIVENFENPGDLDKNMDSDTARDEISDFAGRHGLNRSDVEAYADYMSRENLNGAARAFHEIRRKVRLDNRGVSLGEFTKIFSPIERELYEWFGNIDELRRQYVERTLEERGAMEAARKRAEEAAEAERRRLQEFPFWQLGRDGAAH